MELSSNKKNNEKENDQFVTYSRLLFLFLHNSIVENKDGQIKCFEFINKNFEKLLQLINLTINDLKIQKFLLAIIYNGILLNPTNIKTLSCKHLQLFNILFKSISTASNDKIETKEEKLNKEYQESKDKINSDLKEINEWIHVILSFILKDQNYSLNESINTYNVPDKYFKPNLLNLILFNDNISSNTNIFVIELLRDYIDISKSGNTLEICSANKVLITIVFIQLIEQIFKITDKTRTDKTTESLIDYKIKDYNNEISICFRNFLCFVDILSVLLMHEEYQKIIFELSDINLVITRLIDIMRITDFVYDNKYERFKSAKERLRNEKISEESILYGFQTNLVKFLANFGLNNEKAKEYFINNKLDFFYILNHLRIDTCNPFKKEWSVLFVKTLTESKQR